MSWFRVLLRLDSALTEEGVTHGVRIVTVEHVLPQRPAEGSEWLRQFPDADE
jgi:hypothetical protein